MNERMRELALQVDLMRYPSDGINIKIEKFAELIVKECATQCDLLLNNKMSSEWARGTHDSAKAIRQHFDIKE